MNPFHHSAAPAVDVGVLRRLRRLDRCLFLTWSPWSLDPLSGQPIVPHTSVDPVTGDWINAEPVDDPAWYLWRREENSTKVFWVTAVPGGYYGHEHVAKLEGDLARFMSPDAILRGIAEKRRDVDVKRKERYRERHADTLGANQGRIGDLLAGRSGRRTGKIMSYGGQKNRGTPTQEFLPDAREDGWELPDPE